MLFDKDVKRAQEKFVDTPLENKPAEPEASKQSEPEAPKQLDRAQEVIADINELTTTIRDMANSVYKISLDNEELKDIVDKVVRVFNQEVASITTDRVKSIIETEIIKVAT